MTLHRPPDVDLQDAEVLEDLARLRAGLADVIRTPRRWMGGLRRTTQARAIQGSNTIEGYTVSDEDALAAVDDEVPLSADEQTWAEILGYRRVLTYVVGVGSDPDFVADAQTLRSMHFMLLEHDLAKGPGQWRRGPAYVRRESDGVAVYEAPEPERVPELIAELATTLAGRDGEPLIRAAMAHLNLVMIHPFRDGNGRMARALQTLILAQDQVLDPTFSSIEEWLGGNTELYYRVLAATGQGAWHPENDAHLWVKFILRAHHMQAQTLRRRMAEAEQLGRAVLDRVQRAGLPERTFDPLFDAALGVGCGGPRTSSAPGWNPARPRGTWERWSQPGFSRPTAQPAAAITSPPGLSQICAGRPGGADHPWRTPTPASPRRSHVSRSAPAIPTPGVRPTPVSHFTDGWGPPGAALSRRRSAPGGAPLVRRPMTVRANVRRSMWRATPLGPSDWLPVIPRGAALGRPAAHIDRDSRRPRRGRTRPDACLIRLRACPSGA